MIHGGRRGPCPPLPDPPVPFNPLHPHTRRVCLNLIRLSSVCPPELADALDRLDASGWDFAAQPVADAELVYGFVDVDLATRARDEWCVDTRRRRWYVLSSVTCQLCGHDHNKVEFFCQNTRNGRELWIGSTCVVTWVYQAEGDAVGADALRRIRQSINEVREEVACQKWQDAHPGHVQDMAQIAEVTATWLYTLPTVIVRQYDDLRRLVADAEAASDYYKAKGFLTPVRTAEVYGAPGVGGGLLTWASRLRDHVARVAAVSADVGGYLQRLRDALSAEDVPARDRVVFERLAEDLTRDPVWGARALNASAGTGYRLAGELLRLEAVAGVSEMRV